MSVKLMLGDCLDVMPSLPDGSIDLILADLPYGTTACKWDTIIPLEPLWTQYKRLIKRNGAIVLTASQPFTSALVMSNPKWFRYEWVWDKVLSTGFLDARKKPLKRHENICVFYQSQPTYNPQLTEGVTHGGGKRGNRRTPIQIYSGFREQVAKSNVYYPHTILYPAREPQAGRLHPTQKPVALMEYLIRTYTNEGETVLDNAAGSFTTGVACINTGRSFIGIEKSEEYFAIGQKRIEAAQASARQLTMELTA